MLIICELDGYPNGQKPVEMEQLPASPRAPRRMANTIWLSSALPQDGVDRCSKLPNPAPRKLALYLVQLASLLFTRRWQFGRRHLSYPLVRADLALRRSILRYSLNYRLTTYDMVIGEHPADSELVFDPESARKLYDCMTPWADELYFEGMLTDASTGASRRARRA